MNDREVEALLRRLPDDSGFPDPFDGMLTPREKALRGKFRSEKNGFEAATFRVDPEFGFSGRQRRVGVRQK